MKTLLLLFVIFIPNLGVAQTIQYINPYFRTNGTYVPGHYKTTRDNNIYNNWSTRGNSNPFTGRRGYINPSNSYNSGSFLRPLNPSNYLKPLSPLNNYQDLEELE